MSFYYSMPGFQEPVSAISHLAGALFFLVLSCIMLMRGRGSYGRLAFLFVYCFSVVTLLSLSGVYHMMQFGGTARKVMERLDHGAIFLLIAGTFTPAHGILFQGLWRWVPLLLIWSGAITGITLKSIFLEALPEWLGLAFYLGLGWVGAISATVMWWRFGFRFILPLLFGGIFYTIGATLDFLRWPIVIDGVIGGHEILHFAVLLGAWFHWWFIMQFASGRLPPVVVRGHGAPVRTSSEVETEAGF
ncbi:MAG: hemolysin III family protein [Gemmataceae bacterium]